MPSTRLKCLGPKHETLWLLRWSCICSPELAHSTLHRTLIFNSMVAPNSNGHILLIINPNWATLMSILKHWMSNFECRKPHSKICFESKHIGKRIRKGLFQHYFQNNFEHFWVVIPSLTILNISITLSWNILRSSLGSRIKNY